MTLDQLQASNDSAVPLRFYEFNLGGSVWRYNASDSIVTALGAKWTPLSISDDGVRQTGDIVSDSLTLSLPSSATVTGLFIGTAPSQKLWFRMYEGDDSEPNVPPVPIYIGEVSYVNWPSPSTAEIVCTTLSANLGSNGLRLSWNRGCPFVLYDQGCKVNSASFGVKLVISRVSSALLSAPELPGFETNWFAGGYVEWQDPIRGVERRGIESNDGADMIMFGLTDGLVEGQVVTAFPGCARTTTVCNNKFNNILNYGGIPHRPGRSPFDGNPLF